MQEEPKGEIVIYQAKGGKTTLEVKLQQETVWLSQAQMCDLFDKNKRTVSEHIRNIFQEGELPENSVVRKFRQLQLTVNHMKLTITTLMLSSPSATG